jgi:hypothetical protein
MRHVDSKRWPAVGQKSGWFMPVALFLAVALAGPVLAPRAVSIAATTLAIGQAVWPAAPVSARTHPIASIERWSGVRFLAPSHPAAKAQPTPVAQRPREADVVAQDSELDLAVPVAAAVQSRGLLAALLSLEADGDTTETSEGLGSIASPDAIDDALLGAGPSALPSERSGLPPRDGARLVAASVVDPTYEG